MTTRTTAALWRIGGLAVARGVGGAAAVGLAAAAAAAPSDAESSPARGAPAVSKASQAPAGRVAAGAPARRASVSAAASKPVVALPKPAAAVARPVRAAVRVEPTATAATAAAAVDSVPVPAGRAAPADIWSSLMTRIAGIFGWDPRGRQITIYKGTHFAIPNSFGFFIQQAAGTGTFTSDTVYDLGDEDQFDWNKFSGIAFTPLEPDRDSAMVGWRYNLTSQEFEIAPFYNVNKVRILPNERTEVISVPAGETFQFLVDYTGVTLTYGDQTVFKPYPQGLVPNVWTAARVSGWFGGNEVAPRTVSYYLKLT